MRRFLLAAVMYGVASVAQAADMPDLPFLRGSFTEGLSSSTVNWQGGYVGGHAAYGTSNMNFANSTSNIAARLLDGTEMENVQRISRVADHGKVSAHGEGFGGFVGYNSQWSDVVVGVELNYTHGKFGGSQAGSMSRFFSLPSGYTVGATYEGTARMSISDMGTLRVRGGYAYGSFLPYTVCRHRTRAGRHHSYRPCLRNSGQSERRAAFQERAVRCQRIRRPVQPSDLRLFVWSRHSK